MKLDFIVSFPNFFFFFLYIFNFTLSFCFYIFTFSSVFSLLNFN
jgi:hypothetical protein